MWLSLLTTCHQVSAGNNKWSLDRCQVVYSWTSHTLSLLSLQWLINSSCHKAHPSCHKVNSSLSQPGIPSPIQKWDDSFSCLVLQAVQQHNHHTSPPAPKDPLPVKTEQCGLSRKYYMYRDRMGPRSWFVFKVISGCMFIWKWSKLSECAKNWELSQALADHKNIGYL